MPLPTNISESVRRLNPQLFEQPIATHAQVCAPMGDYGKASVKKRLRQKSGPKMNKTELAFVEHLRATMTNHRHYAQCITLQIANGCRYTPDVMSVSDLTGMWLAWEIKGFMRDDAAIKLKVAATFYPQIVFRLVTKKKGGGWAIEPVLP